MTNAIRLALAALFALALSTPVAAEPYWFLGFSPDDDVKATSRPTMNGNSLEVGAGYRFNRFLAAEASYFDGDGRSDAILRGGTSTTHFWNSSGLGMSALATVPAGPVSLLGRVGAHKLKTDFRALVTDSLGTVSDTTVSESAWASNVGIGAQLSLSQRVALRAMLEQRDGKQLERVRSVSIGVIASF